MGISKIRVLAVDHNPLLREGISVLIRQQPDMELVAVVATYERAIHSFKEHRPAVTLMDLDLPSSSGIRAIEEIRRIDPAACVVGLLTYEWDAPGAQALRAGAFGCVAKDRLNRGLLAMIRNGCRGK